MFFISLILALAGVRGAASIYMSPDLTSGFPNINTSYSNGGGAVCVTADIPVSISATTINLLLSEPANQTVATELIQELSQANSTLAIRSNGGKSTVQGTYRIDSTLCYPRNSTNGRQVKTVQVLTHGIGLDKSYWDIAPGYSYVDAATDAGYATFAYNRLGLGSSDHPDPIQVVQSYTDVEILHGIVGLLRTGKVGSGQFKNVIGVGHSYGSIVELAQTAKYPNDVDAAVLTSFINDVVNLPVTVIANNPAIASINDPSKFGGLPNGYIVHDTPISVQLPFFRFPFFDHTIFQNQYNAKQTYSIGQQFTLPGIYSAAPAFRGPVDIVIGQYDFPFCLGSCEGNTTAATIAALYPGAGAGSQSYIVPDSGHYINAHYEAPQEFAQINKFLQSNGF